MPNASCSIHNRTLSLDSSSPLLASLAGTLLGGFEPAPDPAPISGALRLRSVARPEDLDRLVREHGAGTDQEGGAAAVRAFRGQGDYTFHRTKAADLAVFPGRGLVRLSREGAEAEATFLEPTAQDPEFLLEAVYFAVLELLKQAGLFAPHACAVERAGQGVLFVGASGSGKTTCGLALLRAGYRSLSDDHPLIEGGEPLRVLSFPRPVRFSPHTLRMIPELEAAAGLPMGEDEKRAAEVDSIFPRAQAAEARPTLLLFPRVVKDRSSCLIPLGRADALRELLPHALVAFRQETARREFEFWTRFIREVPAYRLEFGADYLRLPDLLEPLLP